MKCFATLALLACACASLAFAEPPVPQSQYLPPVNQQQPSSNYLPPAQTYQAPSNNYLPPQRNGGGGAGAGPSSSYQAPLAGHSGAVAPPSSSYGAPNYAKQQQQSSGYGSDAGGYGEENYGPAKYEFKYDVQDYESGNDFGHMESRDGDLAIGRYYVLLPDGRKQIVEYEADQNGYRPTIRYEQVNNGLGNGNGNGNNGYDKNAQAGGFGGYQ